MITIEQLPADKVISYLSSYLKENIKDMKPPEWVYFAKTASFKERVPEDPEKWWYIRAASYLRKVYIERAFSVGDARMVYGGRKRRGSQPEEFRRAPGHATRLIVQQLEKAGLLTKSKKGRRLTPKGRALMDRTAKEVFDQLVKSNPELEIYGK